MSKSIFKVVFVVVVKLLCGKFCCVPLKIWSYKFTIVTSSEVMNTIPYQIATYMVQQLSGEEIESHNYILHGY